MKFKKIFLLGIFFSAGYSAHFKENLFHGLTNISQEADLLVGILDKSDYTFEEIKGVLIKEIENLRSENDTSLLLSIAGSYHNDFDFSVFQNSSEKIKEISHKTIESAIEYLNKQGATFSLENFIYYLNNKFEERVEIIKKFKNLLEQQRKKLIKIEINKNKNPVESVLKDLFKEKTDTEEIIDQISEAEHAVFASMATLVSIFITLNRIILHIVSLHENNQHASQPPAVGISPKANVNKSFNINFDDSIDLSPESDSSHWYEKDYNFLDAPSVIATEESMLNESVDHKLNKSVDQDFTQIDDKKHNHESPNTTQNEILLDLQEPDELQLNVLESEVFAKEYPDLFYISPQDLKAKIETINKEYQKLLPDGSYQMRSKMSVMKDELEIAEYILEQKLKNGWGNKK